MELKKPTTYQEQINILKSRGVSIADDSLCEDLLDRIRYYRLSAYLLPFKKADGNYHPVSITQIENIYNFDQAFRTIVFAAIEDIEIRLRSVISYYYSLKYGADGYTYPNNFNGKHDHTEFQNRITNCINENKKTLIVRHHIDKYQGKFPLWVVIEFFSMGMLSYFYIGMQTNDRKAIAKDFGVNYHNLDSWMRCLTDLRNKCAHYSRLYYWVFTAIPRFDESIVIKPDRKLFSQMLMLKTMYPVADKWNGYYLQEIKSTINASIGNINLSHIGFPEDWEQLLTK